MAALGYRVGQLYQQLHRDVMQVPPPAKADTLKKKQLFEGAMRLRYRVLPAETITVRVKDEEFEQCGEYLSNMSVAFEARGPEFTIKGSLPAAITLRADYAAGSVVVELVNVRRLGRVEKPLGAAELKGALDRLGRYVLGIEADFATAP